MFVNVIKNRIVRWVIYAVLGTLCLYNGTSCVAAMYGVICIAITVMLILLVRWKRRNNK